MLFFGHLLVRSFAFTFRSANKGGYQRFQIILPTFASRRKFWVALVFLCMAPSLDGERARQLANTLLGA